MQTAHSERKTNLSTHTKQRAGVAHLDDTSHMWKYHFVPMPPAVSVRKLRVQRHMAIERDAARDRRTKRMSKQRYTLKQPTTKLYFNGADRADNGSRPCEMGTGVRTSFRTMEQQPTPLD